MKAKAYILVKGKGYTPCSYEEATHIELNLPGPLPTRMIPVQTKGTRKDTGNWTWNGSLSKPDLRPSLLSWTDDHRCHSFVNDGKVTFLNDCSHEFAGKTMDLLDVEE
jgi:hypothetical protein